MVPPPGSTVTLEALLGHDAWLRRLAGRLVGGADADDVVQETWLAALARPPADAARGRHWLGRVAKHLARRSRRSARRRQRHEARCARPESEPSAGASLVRLALQREVTQLVLELPEPYRTTIVLHYHEELPARAVAERMQTSEPNVRQRCRRGLELLRARLAATKGHDWRAALAPLVGVPGVGETVVGTGVVLAMKQAIVLVAGCLVIAVAIATSWWPGREPAVGSTGAPAEPVRAVAAAREAGIATTPPPVRSAVEAAPLRGRVVDPEGAPLANVPLRLDDAALATRSDADGRFELAARTASGWLAAGDEYFTFLGWDLRDPDQEVVVVAAPVGFVRGEVHDDGGRPLAGVRVQVHLQKELEYFVLHPDGSRTRREQQGWRWVPTSKIVVAEARSDDRGGFTVRAPRANIELSCVSVGYTTGTVLLDAAGVPMLAAPADATTVELAGERIVYPAPGARTAAVHRRPPVTRDLDGLHVVLERARPKACRIRGRVLDAAGAPVERAFVGFQAHLATETDAAGGFRLAVDPGHLPRLDLPLVASKRGLQPALLHDVLERIHRAHGEEIEVELRLGGAPLSITGVVRKPDGRPWADLLVFPWQSEDLGKDLGTPEDLALPEDAPQFHTGLVARRACARTDAQGRFLLPGLLPRDYHLRLSAQGGFFVMTTGAIAAGTQGVEIVVPASERRRLRGVVRTGDGEPFAELVIKAIIEPDKTAGGMVAAGREIARTDAAGRFEARLALPSEARLWIQQDGFVEHLAELRDLARDEVDIVLARPCAFQVRLPGACQSLELRDALDRLVPIHADAKRHFQEPLGELALGADGWTAVASASEDVAAIVWIDARGETTRRAIRLVPGVVTRLEL